MDIGTESSGDNIWPSALELEIMSLADCILAIFANIWKKKVELSEMEVTAEAKKPSDSHNSWSKHES